MKVSAIILLCAFAAVQGRSAAVASRKYQPNLGEVPYIVHLRIAVQFSGELRTGAASLISSNYALTAASTVFNSRFMWLRLGAAHVVNPSLVLETNDVTTNGFLALIAFNRVVHNTPNIAPVALGGADVSKVDIFCSYGGDGELPGEVLTCFEVVALESEGSIHVTADDAATTKFDIGAPLVADGVQVAILVEENENKTFLPIAGYLDWIEGVTGVDINAPAPPSSESVEDGSDSKEKSSESSEEDSSSSEENKVKFVD